MKPQADRIEHHPAVKEQLRMHIRETEDQVARPERILDTMHESSSTLKDTALSMVGTVTALGHSAAEDEILKNSFADLFENHEIAAYKSLTLVEACGFDQATKLLTESLNEEKAMADWLDQNLSSVTLQYAHLSEMGTTAKA
jgi:ferritin-like metal-binding protein YciE